MFQTNLYKKSSQTFTLLNNFFPRKSCLIVDNEEKYGRAGQAIEENIIQRMRFACWKTKATDTHSEYVILIAFPLQRLRKIDSMLTLYVHCLSYCLSHRDQTGSQPHPASHSTAIGVFLPGRGGGG
jgi:hypothetical protein